MRSFAEARVGDQIIFAVDDPLVKGIEVGDVEEVHVGSATKLVRFTTRDEKTVVGMVVYTAPPALA